MDSNHGVISENGHLNLLREQSASPEPLAQEGTAYFDFQDERQQSPKKSRQDLTNLPQEARRLLEDHEAQNSAESAGLRTNMQRTKTFPASTPGIQNPNRNQTQDSASFAETAVWDQKAILSLGTFKRNINFPQRTVRHRVIDNNSFFSPMKEPELKASARDGLMMRVTPCGCRNYQRAPVHLSNLRTDGGGIRGYSTLLIIRKLMEAIGRLELAYEPGPSEADGQAESSYHPLCPPLKTIQKPKTASSPWLPCHYFDYMAGTSTGG